MEIFLQSVSALNDPTRVQILRFLDIHGACCVCELQQSFDMTQSRLSRHLKILKDAHFLSVERKGTWAYYSIRHPLDAFRSACLEEICHLELSLPALHKFDPQKGCSL